MLLFPLPLSSIPYSTKASIEFSVQCCCYHLLFVVVFQLLIFFGKYLSERIQHKMDNMYDMIMLSDLTGGYDSLAVMFLLLFLPCVQGIQQVFAVFFK